MKRLLPQTLFGQTLVLLLAGIALTLLAGGWIYSSARQEAVRAVGALAAGERIINLTRLVTEAPAEWRARLVRGSNDASFKVAITAERPILSSEGVENPAAAAIADFLKQGLPTRQVIVAVTNAGGFWPGLYRGPGPGFGAGPHGPMAVGPMGSGSMMQGPLMQGPLARAAISWRGLRAAIEIDDGRWLSFSTSLPDTGPTMSPRLLFALAVMATMIALLTVWAVRRMTAPLGMLADAAERLGRNVDAPALTGSGSIEIRRASKAFNEMQSRLRRLIENRTLMLAAISHDLRTQLTLLRLRAEHTGATDERTRMLRTIGEMEDMLSTTLSFARDEASDEARKRADLSALLTSIVDDMADAGLPVEIGDVSDGIIAECKPNALRRAVTNLIDNAVKYGASARVSLRATPAEISILIDDKGPGIPQDQIKQVLQPFYRVEGSRNRDTGGIGLGLAIAASVAEAHGGTLALENRSAGGLRASLSLPR